MPRLPLKLLEKVLLPVSIISLLMGLSFLQHSQLVQHTQEETVSLKEMKRDVNAEELRLNLLTRIPVFGFRNLVADWTFLRFLQYFGDDSARAKTDYSLSPTYFQVIVNRDPFFTSVYNYLFTSVSLYAGEPKVAVALTDQALQSMSPTKLPTSYLIWRNKSLDELLLLNDVDKAIASLETSASWAEQSSEPNARQVAKASLQSAEFLKTNPDSRIARALAWSNIIVRAVDDRSRQLAIKKVEEFGGQVTIENGAVRVFIPAEVQGR